MLCLALFLLVWLPETINALKASIHTSGKKKSALFLKLFGPLWCCFVITKLQRKEYTTTTKAYDRHRLWCAMTIQCTRGKLRLLKEHKMEKKKATMYGIYRILIIYSTSFSPLLTFLNISFVGQHHERYSTSSDIVLVGRCIFRACASNYSTYQSGAWAWMDSVYTLYCRGYCSNHFVRHLSCLDPSSFSSASCSLGKTEQTTYQDFSAQDICVSAGKHQSLFWIHR